MTHEQPIKRRIRLIQPAFQLRLISIFAGLTALALITQVLVLGTLLSRFAAGLGQSGLRLGIEMPTLLMTCLGLSAVMVLPALVVIGVRVTFRIAGPLYRMERHLEGIANGDEIRRCTIRQGDDLQGFCETLNRALERVKEDAPRTLESAEDDSIERTAA